MKKLHLLLGIAALLFLFSTQSAKAQITKINSFGGTDSFDYPYCVLPNIQTHMLTGQVFGTFGSADSVLINMNFGDGTDTTIKVPIVAYSSGRFFSASLSHTYTFPGTFGNVIIIKAASGVADTLTGSTFKLSNTCGVLNGNLYLDANNNCTKESTEQDVYGEPIIAVNTSTLDTTFEGWSDSRGHYSLSLLPGTYTIIPNVGNYYYAGLTVDTNIIPTCPSTGVYTLTVAASGSYTKDFAYSCKPISTFDAKIVVGSRGFVPGDSTYVNFWGGSWLWYFHYTCSSLSSSVSVSLDSKLTYVKPFFGLTPTVSGSTLTYILSSTSDVTSFYSGIWVAVSSAATLGDTVRIGANIAATTFTDPDMSNNTYNYKHVVASSYDPNMKEVAPTGNGSQGYIANNTPLTYTIHFQNTGTANAKNITVTDKIDANLDINSIHMLGATHNADMYRDGNTIKFRFENINLPYSSSNYAASMGSITYGIMPKKGLSPGTKMNNTAAIYFDYNAPIITNTTLNTIEIPTNIEHISKGNLAAQVYPNPANTQLNIKMDNNINFSVTIIDMLGRTTAIESTGNGMIVIPTQSLSAGTYVVNIKDAEGNQLNTKVVVRH